MDVFELERRGKAEYEGALEELARCFVFVTPEDDEIVLEPVVGHGQ
jgi:hypothetical protein